MVTGTEFEVGVDMDDFLVLLLGHRRYLIMVALNRR
jgi:hypothetical protein